jgi:hypothetical protein
LSLLVTLISSFVLPLTQPGSWLQRRILLFPRSPHPTHERASVLRVALLQSQQYYMENTFKRCSLSV